MKAPIVAYDKRKPPFTPARLSDKSAFNEISIEQQAIIVAVQGNILILDQPI